MAKRTFLVEDSQLMTDMVQRIVKEPDVDFKIAGLIYKNKQLVYKTASKPPTRFLIAQWCGSVLLYNNQWYEFVPFRWYNTNYTNPIQQAFIETESLVNGKKHTSLNKEGGTVLQPTPLTTLCRRAGVEEFGSFNYKGVVIDLLDTRPQTKKKRGVHYSPTLLLKIRDNVFLCDYDQNELLNYNIVNYFVTELYKDRALSVSTIDEAYETLKPTAVKEAESKGLKVFRQGEWFFVEATKEELDLFPAEVLATSTFDDYANYTERGNAHLVTGGSFPDYEPDETYYDTSAEKILVPLESYSSHHAIHAIQKDGTFLVKEVIHNQGSYSRPHFNQERHADLKLPVWCVPHQSIATASWSIGGDVD